MDNKIIKIDFKKFDNLKGKKDKDENISPKELAKRQKIEQEIVRINKRYRKLSKALKASKSDIQTNIRVLKYCFNMSTRLLPIAEEIYITYKNERGMYAMNALVSQIRELSNDIRMLSSNDKTIEYVLQSVFLPSLQLILQHFVSDFSELKTVINDTLPEKKSKDLKIRMNKMLKAQGQLLNDISKSVTEKIEQHFE